MKYDQAGDGNYNAATQVTESVAAQKANQIITVEHACAGERHLTTPVSRLRPLSNSVWQSRYGSSGRAPTSAPTFTMTSGTGTCTVKYDQAGDSNYNCGNSGD